MQPQRMQCISITFGIQCGVMIMVTGADMNCGPGQDCTTLFMLTTTQLTASGHTEKPPVLAHTLPSAAGRIIQLIATIT